MKNSKPRINANLGQTTLRKTRRKSDPMRAYDALPADLRHWMMNASLPWSPKSCLKIWRKAQNKGASPIEIQQRLTQLETLMLARDQTNRNGHNS